MITDRALRDGDGIVLFEIDGAEIRVPVLTMNRASAWAEKAREFDTAGFAMSRVIDRMVRAGSIERKTKEKFEALINDPGADLEDIDRMAEKIEAVSDSIEKIMGETLALQDKRQRVIADSVAGYDSDTLTPDILEKATASQVISAFYTLRKINDPFWLTASSAGAAANVKKSAEPHMSPSGSVESPMPNGTPQSPQTSPEPETSQTPSN